MSAIPHTAETLALARRLIWFEPAECALADADRFLAYAFRHATHEEMKLLRHHLPDHVFRHALDNAPPGIVDARSWAYWRLMFDLPACAPPVRRLA